MSRKELSRISVTMSFPEYKKGITASTVIPPTLSKTVPLPISLGWQRPPRPG